jgi:RNA-directed DNA polymerase
MRDILLTLVKWIGYLIGGAFGLFALLIFGIVLVVVVVTTYKRIRKALRERRVRLGRGKSVEKLAKRLQLEPELLRSFQPAYRTAFIKKRSGGERKLAIPDPATMKLQRTILRRLLKKLRVHPSCIGFEPGKSIVHNALPHVGRAVVLKFDIVDFFPRTTAARLDRYFRMIGWNAEAAALLTKFCTHEDGLPQGAPTSPRLSNLVNFGLDNIFQKIALRRKGTYTRYADDITFSFPKDYPKKMRGVCQLVKQLVNKHGYELKKEKTHTIRRHQRQMVTGLVVNEKVQLSRGKRRQLRAIEHRLRNNRRATMTEAQFAGWQALQKMIRQQVAVAATETATKTAKN